MNRKLVIIGSLITVLFIGGCVHRNEEDASTRGGEIQGRLLDKTDEEWDRLFERLFAEESYQEVADLFESMKDEMNRVIRFTEEDDMLNNHERFFITFFTEREYHDTKRWVRGDIIMYDGDISEERSSSELVAFLRNNAELFYTIKDISERGVVRGIGITIEPRKRVNFYIRPQSLTFVDSDMERVVDIFYIYSIVELQTESRRIRRLEDNWYMQIMHTID
jgi:hypothetical protein